MSETSSTATAVPHQGLFDKVKDALKPHRGRETSKERAVAAEEEHRGRTKAAGQYMSTGRGGAGNIVRSPSRDPKDVAAEEAEERRLERSISRERQGRSSSRVRMGRGGAGNYASPTREDLSREQADRAYEAQIIADSIARDEAHFHSTGRGGAGNMLKAPMEADLREEALDGDEVVRH